MHILQHPLRGKVNRKAKIGKKSVVPRGFKISDRQIALDQRALKVKAEHDMQIILHLICFGADVALFDSINRPIKSVGVGHAKITKMLGHLLKKPSSKRTRAAKLILINATLTFMHPHRYALPKWGQREGGAYILFITGVAHFMYR